MSSTPIENLKAADLMQRDIVTIGPKDSLQDAMAAMTENHVTGLPVLDTKEHCIGLITSTDILNYEQEHAEEAAEANADMARHFNPESQKWESLRVTAFDLEEFAETPVSELMTRELVAVSPDTPVQEVAQRMVDEEVHRVLVLDDERFLLGLVSATDFVRLVAEKG